MNVREIKNITIRTKIEDFASIIDLSNVLSPQEKLMVFFRLRPGGGESQEQIARFFRISQPAVIYRLKKIRKKFKKTWI